MLTPPSASSRQRPASARGMTVYTTFEELECSVPLAELLPSIAFGRCAAPLPQDVDSLHGDELVRSMEVALAIHSKARVVLQCWVLLILRRRAGLRHEKDALYDRLQLAPVNPQEKLRYRRGAMLLCHLLVERDAVESMSGSLLDRYLDGFYFSWSSAVNEQDDAFYLQGNAVIPWVRRALEYQDQNGSKMTAGRWLELSRSTSTSAAAVLPVPSLPQPCPLAPPDWLDTLISASVSVEQAAPSPLARHTRSRDLDRILSTPAPTPPPVSFTVRPSASSSCPPLISIHQTQKRRRSERTELESLRKAVGRWAKRLRRQLLDAALTNDQDNIRRVADQLQAPPLQRKAVRRTRERRTVDKDSTAQEDDRGIEETRTTSADHRSASACPSTSSDTDGSSSSSGSSRNNNITLQERMSALCVQKSQHEWNRCGTSAVVTASAASACTPACLSGRESAWVAEST